MPGATEVPKVRIEHFETPSPHTEFGAKGMGEGGAIAPPAVIFGAVNDALARRGVPELLSTPLTPRRLLEALAGHGAPAAAAPAKAASPKRATKTPRKARAPKGEQA